MDECLQRFDFKIVTCMHLLKIINNSNFSKNQWRMVTIVNAFTCGAFVEVIQKDEDVIALFLK